MTQIHPLAKIELEDAAIYYTDMSPQLAERFLDDFEQTLSFIETVPLAWAICYLTFRKLNFKIFPYSIVYNYSPDDGEIVVFAIQHQSREPFYWKDRV